MMDIARFLSQCKKVFLVARKPSSDYKRTAKITGLGIFLIGLVGFLIWLVTQSWRM